MTGHSTHRRRSWLKAAGASLISGCGSPELTPQIGSRAAFSHLGLRLFVTEDLQSRELHVALTNVSDDVFIVYSSDESAPDWHGLIEADARTLIYGPREGLVPDPPGVMFTRCNVPITRELRLGKRDWWRSSISLESLVFVDHRPEALYSGSLASRNVVLKDLAIGVVAPLESIVEFDGTGAHWQISRKNWAKHFVGGPIRLASAPMVRLVEPSQADKPANP